MMHYKRLLIVCGVFLAVFIPVSIAVAQGPAPRVARAPHASVGTGFTYQGHLKNSGVPVNGTCDFQFSLWDSSTAGTQIGGTQTANSVILSNGLFTATIDFGANVITGDARWLATSVRCPAGSGSYTPLSRQAITPSPMALALPGMYTQQTTSSPNLIGGYSGNTVNPGTVGAAINGGGDAGGINNVSGNYATIGGGTGNTASGNNATVPGGVSNLAQGNYSFAAGQQAQALNQGSFVWADSQKSPFASTGNDQFLIRAKGGVGINTNNPTANLEVAGGDVKVSQAGSGIVFSDGSKQTTAPSKILGYEHFVSSSNNVTTTQKVMGTITVTTGTSVLYYYAVPYTFDTCAGIHAGLQLIVSVYLDGSFLDNNQAYFTYLRLSPTDCIVTGGILSDFKLISLSPGIHNFQIRASSSVTDTTVYASNGKIFVINQ